MIQPKHLQHHLVNLPTHASLTTLSLQVVAVLLTFIFLGLLFGFAVNLV